MLQYEQVHLLLLATDVVAVACVQARTELLNGLASVYQAQKEVFDLQDTLLLLKWVDAFVRYPVGADDVTPVHGVLPPVQKSVLAVLGHLCPVSGANSNVTSCSQLCLL